MKATDEPTPPPGGNAGPPGAGDEYSATVLGSQWFQRPEPDTTVTATVRDVPGGDTRPDRIEGAVLRFGPGVQGALAHRSARTPPPAPPPTRARRPGPRRYALPALVLLAVLVLLAWQRLGPALAVRGAAITAPSATVGCGGTADVVGTVTTNGRPGTLAYRWTRSDGTSSGVLREEMARGQKEARLHLRWTFEGTGRYEARAELRILSPSGRTSTAGLTYACP
ncbi:hypothetical protein HTV45_25600 [Streptomyces sp. CHD11]|uniref:hypothetical protein n=1 Tax=Streptomyces sp. CHD11 TaxID=2741325 RepID=UPI001BFC5FDF|nr:hypothetical protein [Streptomyces sp. CHD11]MBT3154206.1 hypothetical protein [Streptomyces sp. CHD11]